MCVRDSILRGMELVRSRSLKSSHGFVALLRNASFSSGWLHLAVQSFFAVITVASFILIIIMSIPKIPEVKPVPPRESRCHSHQQNCMVNCDEVPYFRKHKEDIVHAVANLPDSCTEFQLTLNKPMFINETLPIHWLPRLRLPIYELSIIEGNLMHFPPEAFLIQQAASIRTLVLCGLLIKTFTMNSLVGLSRLSQLHIKKSTIINMHSHVLQPVDETLELLTITESEQWDPVNITGRTNLGRLSTVDFSHNYFDDILNEYSFTGLEKCKILYLNSCKISVIGAGAFDNLNSIEMLYLNDNFIVTIPVGLFDNILLLHSPKPRINLRDNLWYCDCHNKDMRQLVSSGILLIDPICVSPENYKGKSFTEFQIYCNNDTDLELSSSYELSSKNIRNGDVSGIVYINNGCYNGNESSNNVSMRILSPLHGHSCWSGEIYRQNLTRLTKRNENHILSENNWIKFTFFFKSGSYSMIQIGAKETDNYGLLWHQTSCPNEVYCVNIVPTALRVYNIDLNAHYVFCPVRLASGAVETEKCIFYNLATIDSYDMEYKLRILLYMCTGGICLVMGAAFVYALVRKNPTLLKGSKRIVFVKHKSLDALVMPPKVPIRNQFKPDISPEITARQIFTLSTCSLDGFNRNKSTRSSKSNAPSYISALQPTEDQLAEWRIKNHFNNDLTICSAEFFPYIEISDGEKIYESLK